jgi:DNA ligase 1
MKLKPLYKRSTTGKISFWQIEIEENKFRTESGFTDGQKVINEWTICEGKSYNTSNEQALKQAKAIHKKKIELGAFEKIEDIDNPILFKPMLAHDYIDYKNKIKFPIWSQPKLDGVRCICTSTGMFSRNGKRIISAPHILESLELFFKSNPDVILDGELYCDKLANDFNKIVSCVRKTKPTQEDLKESKKYIDYHVYDLPSHVGSFEDRINKLDEMLSSYHINIKVVTTTKIFNEEEIHIYYTEYIEDGYEGQMLREPDSLYENKRSKSLLKHKSFITEEFKIVKIIEGLGKLSGKVGKISILTKNGTLVDSAVNGEHSYLEDLWNNRENLIGKEATVRFFNYTEDGSLRFPKIIDIGRDDI